MRSRLLTAFVGATVAGLCVPALGGAQTPVPITQKTVTTQGAAQEKVTPVNRKNNASIAAAVERAEAKARPAALASARENATALAQVAGLTLGGIVAISEYSNYGPFGPGGARFGPGQYCGTVKVAVTKLGSDGKRHRTGTRTRHECIVPATVNDQVSVTFAAT
jgi:uncharacterized protein YggE